MKRIFTYLILLFGIYSPSLLESLKLHNEALLLVLKGKISRFFLWWLSDSFYWSFKNTRRCDASHTVYFLLNGKLPYCRARVSVEKSGDSSSRKDSSTNFWGELNLCFLIFSVGTQTGANIRKTKWYKKWYTAFRKGWSIIQMQNAFNHKWVYASVGSLMALSINMLISIRKSFLLDFAKGSNAWLFFRTYVHSAIMHYLLYVIIMH